MRCVRVDGFVQPAVASIRPCAPKLPGAGRTFVFSTSLERITGHLKIKDYERALESLSKTRGWSGDTIIGPSLGAFDAEWAKLVDKRTIVIILSDGRDTREPEHLAASLAGLKRRAVKLIWLKLPAADSRNASRASVSGSVCALT